GMCIAGLRSSFSTAKESFVTAMSAMAWPRRWRSCCGTNRFVVPASAGRTSRIQEALDYLASDRLKPGLRTGLRTLRGGGTDVFADGVANLAAPVLQVAGGAAFDDRA